MPGGFHPFHAGHAALYQSALNAFPDADVYVAATNSQETRPFPFTVKEKLAKLAGVADKHFVQVKSPFRAEEITSHYNPNKDVLIFIRSEKDKNESPKPGGIKKDGSPSYFQPWTGKDVQPFAKHAYFAYLPTVEFGPGITSASEIRNAWPKLDDRRKTAMVMSLYPRTQKNQKLAANIVGMLDQVMGGQEGVAEGGAETSWSNDTDTITLQDILELTKHIKQINLPINDNLKSKLLHWEGNPEEIERVNQVTVSNQFPILIMVDEQGQIAWILDGNHRLHKAIQSQAKTIPAKLIRPSNLDDKAKKIFNIKEQGVAEGKVINTYLWHGSRQKIPMLEPRQSVDTGGAAGSNQNAIYATSDPKVAIAMGLTTLGSDTGMFPNDPQMVLFSGKIRKGEYVYLHKLPFNGPDGKPQFVQGGNSREFHSIPGVKNIKPIEIKEIPVNKYLNLIRKATPADLKLRKKYMKEQGVAEGSEKKDNLIWTLNSFGYYSDNSSVYVNDDGDKIVRVGSEWKHQSGKRGRGPEELGNFLSSLQDVSEGFGLPMPGTYEQEHGTRTPSRKQHITAMTYENDMSKTSDYIDEK
jgi:hypothetical protein